MSDDKKKTPEKTVKLRAVRDIFVPSLKKVMSTGTIFEALESEVEELTAPFKLHMDGWGESFAKPHELRRCVPA